MTPNQLLGRSLLLLGLGVAGVGLLLLAGGRIPWLGRLPGDLRIEREGFRLYLPLTSSLLISAIASLLLYLIGRFGR